MTIYTEDSEDESEEQNLADEEFDEIDLNISTLQNRLAELPEFDEFDLNILMVQKGLDELKALRLELLNSKKLKLSREKSRLSTPNLNLSKQSFVSFALPNQSNSEKKPAANSAHLYYEGDSEDERDDDESKYENDYYQDGDDDVRSYFPCPFCYVDIEVHLLCSHFRDEHCFDLKKAVCPICAANLGKDVIGHFIVQHANSLKRRRKPKKSGLWTGSSAMLGKELSSFLGSSANGKADAHESVPNSLISPLSHSDPIGSQQDESSNRKASPTAHYKSAEMSSRSNNELDSEERSNRTAFVQQLIASTIF